MRLPTSLAELRGLRAAGWGRESTGRQAERFGPAAQAEQRARAIAEFDMIDTGLVWQVSHSGRTIASTRQFSEMLARAGRDYDVLVVGYVSRFTRDLRTAVNARYQLHQAGAALLFADERVLSSDETAWENWARETVEAEAYSRRLARSVHAGYAAKIRDYADQGGGLVPLGFRRAGPHKLLEPDPDQMPLAVQVYALAAAGLADAAIAASTGLSLWTVRDVLRSPLYGGRLRDGRPTRFPAPVDRALIERAEAYRRERTRVGNRLRRNRTYALAGHGPLVCDVCGLAAKGDTRGRRNGTKIAVYRHRDGPDCAGWRVRETPVAVLEAQVAALLDGATPNRESASRIRAVLARPPALPDRLGIARLDQRLRALALELAAPAPERSTAEIVAELEATRSERQLLAASPIEDDGVDPEAALSWLASLGRLWRETSDEGRRRLAVATFARLGVVSGRRPGTHRIVSVELTEEAERRGLVLALPASLEVTMVGDTGLSPTRVTSWPLRIAHRSDWLAAAERRSA
jgi:DNA invertase Pin-like site-specific DNA recombinase